MNTLRLGAVVLLTLAFLLPTAADEAAKAKSYRSPYTVKFSESEEDLIGDILKGPRGDPHEESDVSHKDWYSHEVRKKYGSWGPPQRQYAAPQGLAGRSHAWKQQRVIAVALRFRGYAYQHHHVPDWEPPKDWPGLLTSQERGRKGVDCSNFTAFVYNQGFGIHPSGDVHKQAEELEIPGPGLGHRLRAERVAKPKTYKELVETLQTGDLVYICKKPGEKIAHVVLWVGAVGHSPDGTPLIIDSHGDEVKDSNGSHIPNGIHLRPFREHSWYYESFSHAHRIFTGK